MHYRDQKLDTLSSRSISYKTLATPTPYLKIIAPSINFLRQKHLVISTFFAWSTSNYLELVTALVDTRLQALERSVSMLLGKTRFRPSLQCT